MTEANGIIAKLNKRAKDAMALLKTNPLPFLLLALAYGIVEMYFLKDLLMQLTNIMEILAHPWVVFELAIYEAIRVVFIIGFIKMLLALADNKPLSLRDFRSFITKKQLIRMLMLESVIVPILMVGGMLLILPGFIWATLTIFSYFIVVQNEDAPIFDSISKSITMTSGVRTELFTLYIIYGVFSLILLIMPVLFLIMDTFITPFLGVILVMIFKEKQSA